MAEEERTLKTFAITLRDSWFDTPLARGDIAHVTSIGRLEETPSPTHLLGQIMISDAADSSMLIVHPDHMLTATSIADSFDCTRKAVLQQRIRASGEANKPVVYGNILHEIFQKALSANQWGEAFLSEVVEETVTNHVEDLWLLGMEDTVLAIEEIKAKMGEMASWARIFVAEQPSEVATIDGRQGDKARMSISKLIAIEEHIWSPQFGLQGKIDATVQMTEIEKPDGASRKLLHPFEVKTGRTTWSAMHLVQTALYTLLLSDRYDVHVATGILYYLESSAMSRIAPPVAELRQMLQQRNRLASLLQRARSPLADAEDLAKQTQEIETSGLPGLLRNPFKCSTCYAQSSCFSYHALAEGGTAESAGMVDDGKKNYGAVWAEAVGHLLLGLSDKSQADTLKQWFIKWDRLLSFEERDMSKLLKELWTMDSIEREAVGRCFGNLVIAREITSSAAVSASAVTDGIEGAGGKINRFVYVLQRSIHVGSQSFAEGSQLAVGEVVAVSSESEQWGLARGYVIAVTKHEITVAVDRKLGDARHRLAGFDGKRNQTFKGIMTVGADDSNRSDSIPTITFRLDKDEFSNGLAVVRSNLIALMSSHPIHTKLRNQIIFGAKPTFAASTTAPALPASQLGEMNEDQRATVDKVLTAQDYALILGMPGTGKTTTIAHVVRALLAENKSILVTSFTHTAVDNILLKIKDLVPPQSILRIGTISKINSEVQKFCQLATTPRETIEQVDQAYMGCRIVATTCMSANHAIFSRRKFDVCIVDEASQITLPISLGPLLHARKFVLVGDHYQLPPLVQNKNALEGGLDVSLFRQLSEEHPQAVAVLGKQYRMCEEIMTLANVLIYSGNLRCGNEAVAERQLQNVDLSRLSSYHNSSNVCSSSGTSENCWLHTVCQPTNKVLYLNTDTLGPLAHENLTTGKNITNFLEATLAAQSVLSLLAVGVPANEIGVITLYRSQLSLIRRTFKLASISREVDIDSADRFQGRDKDVIVISMVRSNAGGVVGELLKDWRRVNVAFTRAKSKLVVLGSKRTLGGNEVLKKFLDLVAERGWGTDLPPAADQLHGFDFSSQVVASGLQGSPIKEEALAQILTPKSAKRPAQSRSSSKPSPTLPSPSPRRVLQESTNAANRSPSRLSGLKRVPAKVVCGKAMGRKIKLSQAAMDIFEDLTENDI